MRSLSYLNKYFFKYRYRICAGFLFIILSNIFALFPVNLIGRTFNLIIDKIKEFNLNGEVNYDGIYYLLLVYVLLLVFFALLKGVFMFFMRQNIIVVSRHIEYEIKNDIYSHYQKMSSNFYKNHDIGDLLNRLTEDVSRVRMYLGPAVMYTFNLVTLITLIVSRMLFISPILTLIVLAPLPILAFLIYRVSHIINLKSTIVQNKLSQLTNVVQETFSGIRLVKSFVREYNIIENFNTHSKEYMSQYISLSKTNAIFFPLMLLMVGCSTILTIYVGGILYINGEVTVGEITEYIIYVNMLTWPVTSIGWVTEVIQRAAASQNRINEFLHKEDYSLFFKYIENNNIDILDKDILLDHVGYKYEDADIFCLSDINIKVLKGSTVAFVGNVGSGKTTVMQIFAGILSPSKGFFLFENYHFNDIDSNFFRQNVAYVPQDVFLFSDTIKNNIIFGGIDVKDKDLFYIVEKLCLLEEIESFQDGFNTQIGEGGVTLSGGQKQRIALARALIKKPKIILLDDALSNVDSDTESKIINFIKSTFNDSTVVLTSNRLSVLEYCDNIFMLSNGKVVESGTHQYLMNVKNKYYNLFLSQLFKAH
jgi:ATP-binding cassette subfamily B multidrug efflux pump